MLKNLDFLQKGKSFPPDSEQDRMDRYRNNRMLFEDEHAEVYKEQFGRIERVIGNFRQVVSYTTVFNFQKLMTLKIADFIFGEPPEISIADEELQDCIENILSDTNFFGKMYMAAIDVSRYGDGIFQAYEHNGKADFDVFSPRYWFPVVDNNNIHKFLYHCFCTIYIIDSKREKYGLSVQIHKPDEPGRCEERTYELDGKPGSFKIGKMLTKKGEPDMETKFNVCSVFRVSNTATSDRCFGIDDYSSVDSIISELCIRVSQVSKVLDKFSNPSISGPQSALTWNDDLQRWEFKIADYYPRDEESDPKPEMLVWDANLDANFKQIELLTNMLYTISEMGSAVFGDISNSTGNVASGSALRRLMISPLAKAKRVRNGFDGVIKQLISILASGYGKTILPKDISITWQDGLPNDPVEEASIMNIRTGGKATMSVTRAIKQFDGLSEKDTMKELELIEADEIAATAGEMPVNEPEDTVVEK